MSRSLATLIAIAASIGAGLIHLALGPEHLEELGALGLGFYLAAALQLGWAIAVVAVLAVPSSADRRLRAVALAGIAMNVAILGAWVVSRTLGLPAGEMPWVPEAVGRADLICAALEVGIVGTLAFQVRSALEASPSTQASRARRTLPRREPVRLAAALAIAAIVAATAAGLAPDDAHAAAHDEGEGGHVHLMDNMGEPNP
jgi:hypothetical protein